MDLTTYTNRLTNAMRSVKPVSARPQPTDVFVQPNLRYSTYAFVRRDSHRRPLESAYKGPFKVVQRESKRYVIGKNGTNDSISIDHLKAAYLEGLPIDVEFASVQTHNTTPTLIIPHPTANTHDDTSTVSENKLKTTRSRRRRQSSQIALNNQLFNSNPISHPLLSGSHTYNDGIKYNNQVVICDDSTLSGMVDPVRTRLILKVEIS
ncbi:unnamed protein product [Schistosoma margrebowiei]|uniref:Uncharacterized protein n=1 Tax=Schistosoma margrebowiei TaxID=48269 RepID=A0A183M3Q6_9TREM|nr:unnamed protein product [Schistosoma margrebowiei]